MEKLEPIKQDMQGLKEDVQGLKQDVQDLKDGQARLEQMVSQDVEISRRVYCEDNGIYG